MAEAIAILREHGSAARPLAGGSDLVAGLMRDAVAGRGMPYPSHLVDLSTIPDLRGVRLGPEGARIGAATTLAEVADSADLRRGWPLLVDAVESVASPDIRAVATLGGNIHQRPRCWFFRGRDFDCLKKGGDTCFAVEGHNRYHAIVDGDLCFIVHPSDTATALVALEARARVASATGERVVPLGEYFVAPRQNLLAETILRPDELLLEIVVPPLPPGARTAWRKVTDKNRSIWDFALVSVAALVVAADGVWRDGRIVLGGVAPTPYRAKVVEEALAGRRIQGAIAGAAGRIQSVARPLRDNADKVVLAQALIERAVLDAVA